MERTARAQRPHTTDESKSEGRGEGGRWKRMQIAEKKWDTETNGGGPACRFLRRRKMSCRRTEDSDGGNMGEFNKEGVG